MVAHRHLCVPIHTCAHWGKFCNISTINNVFISEILYIAFHYVCINRHALGIVMQHRYSSQELLPSFRFVFPFLYLMNCNVHIFHVYPRKNYLFHSVKTLCPILKKKGWGGSQTSLFIFILILNYLYRPFWRKKTLLVVLSNKLFVTHMIVVKIQ